MKNFQLKQMSTDETALIEPLECTGFLLGIFKWTRLK